MAFTRRPLISNNNPNEATGGGPTIHRSPVEHPDDEMDSIIGPPPPSIHRTSHQQQQQQQHRSPTAQQSSTPSPPLPQLLSSQPHHHVAATSSLASKPHAFGGAILSPDHARNLTTDLALNLASALSVQASHAASSRGVLPPGENVNLFKGSELVDVLTGWKQHTNGDALGGMMMMGNNNSVFRRSVSSAASTPSTATPGTPKSNGNAPAPHILQLLHHGGAAPSPNPKQSTPGASTPGNFTTGSASSNNVVATSPMNTPTDASSVNPAAGAAVAATTVPINPLSLLSTAEALESFAAWRTHYTVWITEAWHILKWSEPSAALFWEMATMFHTLYVASLSNGGGGSGGAVRSRVLGVGGASHDASDGGEVGAGGGSSSVAASGTAVRSSAAASTAAASPANGGNYIPPLLSCGSQSSMGSVRSAGTAGSNRHAGDAERKDAHAAGANAQAQHNNMPSPSASRGGTIKTARHSAKELPVWLISMFLLVHCENEAFLRCTSGEDERRFGDGATSPLAGDGEGSLDFSALLHHRSLSPRTRLHAGMHQNNANCASFVLRHLRKFLLLCAVPRNVAACKAVATLAARGVSSEKKSNVHRYSGSGVYNIDIAQMELQHEKEHGNVGLTVELTVEELDRLHLVLQAPSGGLVDDPPIAIGEHIVRCLAMEEMEAAREGAAGLGKANNAAPTSHRWNLMQNGLITVADAERILRRYLVEELTMAKQELDGEDDLRSSVTGGEDVAAKLSKLSLGSSETSRGSPSNQPLSPTRRGDSADADAVKDSSYFKELSYHKLSSTTVLLEPGKDTAHGSLMNNHEDSIAATDSHSLRSGSSGGHKQQAGADPMHAENNGRLHDLHVADCTDTHFYLLQPFEHATIAACTDCTIVLGAVAGLLHVVDCERTCITSAARRVVVSNSLDVVHYLFTPSPPLLVGDNRGCQFAPYNTYYEGLREDLLATGLAAVLRSSSAARDSNSPRDGSVVGGDGNTTASPGRGGSSSPTSAQPTLQCASNKWKVPVELCKLEVPQLPHVPTPGSPGSLDAPSSPGADDRALNGSSDVAMKTPVLLPSSEFDVLLVPVESEEARIRRQLLRESEEEFAAAAAAANKNEEISSDAGGDEAGETTTVYSTTSTLTGITEKPSEQHPPPPESDYCRILADLLTLSPFHMPHDYERRVISKAERVRTLREAIVQELTEDGRSSLEEELNRGFQDWLVTSGNLRQVLDLIHLEKRVSAI